MIASPKVPYLRQREIEDAAAALLARYAAWKASDVQPPIPVDDVVEGFLGLSLVVDDLRGRFDTDALGATWIADAKVMIDSSLEGNEGRFAFTLAHETGHWDLHRPLVLAGRATLSLFPREPGGEPSPAIVCRWSNRRDRAEWQADAFAAALLMPPHEMRAAARAAFDGEIPKAPGAEERERGDALPPELRGLADRLIEAGSFWNVSNEAMCYRMLDLRLVTDSTKRQQSLL